jgi:ribulose-5-phosphate 4-epimerase/fuculose-1-phosphate aldolase
MASEEWDDLPIRAQVAVVGRILARAGLVHAFGHVSARSPNGLVMTPVFPPLAALVETDVRVLAPDTSPLDGKRRGVPLEAPMHAAIYAARPDVTAICRIHGRAAAAWATHPEPPPLLHGFGGIVEPVAMWPDPDLVADETAAHGVAAALGPGLAILLRGTGGLAVGRDLAEAAARAWCLEDRCAIAERAAGSGVPFSLEDLARRSRWYDAETSRLWSWLLATYGGDS